MTSNPGHVPKPNVKWLTDVTEFKWYEGVEVHKIYLSAIPDLYDRRIVSYVISEHNDNPIVFDTFKAAAKANPDAHPLFHSDRGFQYTNRIPPGARHWGKGSAEGETPLAGALGILRLHGP